MVTTLDLSNDILELIFHCVCLSDADARDRYSHRGEGEVNQPPVFERPPQHIVSSVCTRWYRAAQGFTSLWASISVVFNKQTTKSQWIFIEHTVTEALVKSRNAPLTLRIIDTGFGYNPKPRSQLQHILEHLLLKHSSRWKSFRLQMRCMTIRPTTFPAHLDLPILEDLHLISSVILDMPKPFTHTPRLTRITAVNIANLELPWHQITAITLQNDHSETVRLTLQKCLTSPILEHIHCHGQYTPPAGHLVQLIHTGVRDVRLPASNWLAHATLPSLQTLVCHFNYDDKDLTLLIAALHVSGCSR